MSAFVSLSFALGTGLILLVLLLVVRLLVAIFTPELRTHIRARWRLHVIWGFISALTVQMLWVVAPNKDETEPTFVWIGEHTFYGVLVVVLVLGMILIPIVFVMECIATLFSSNQRKRLEKWWPLYLIWGIASWFCFVGLFAGSTPHQL